jgi:cobalt-zinc-cadmium efflux system protein
MSTVTNSGSKNENSFSVGMLLNSVYAITEATVGFFIGSMALVTDALHNIFDIISLGTSWIADKLMHTRPTNHHTYGYKGASLIATTLNAAALLVAMLLIIVEAVRNIGVADNVRGSVVILVSGVGIVVNGVTAPMFVKNQQKDLNVKAAFMHMAADAGVSFAVLVSGLILTLTNWKWIDAAMSIFVACVVLVEAIKLLLKALNLELYAVPDTINPDEVKDAIGSFPTVESFHDLHIWAVSTADTALTVHVKRTTRNNNDMFICELESELEKEFRIDHITIQIECGDFQPLLNTDNNY